MKTKVIAQARVATSAVLLFISLWGVSIRAGDSPGQWVLVTTPRFRPVLTPLIEHRRSEGFDVVVLETAGKAAPDGASPGADSALHARLQPLLRGRKGPCYLLLAGAIKPWADGHGLDAVVPGMPGEVGRMKGEPCDCAYGLPGPDGAPTVAVGRFPARNEKEMQDMVRKTLAFEQDNPPETWQQRLLLIIGNPGGGRMAEWYVENAVAKDLGSLYPGWVGRILFNVESSPYYLPRPEARRTAIEYLQQGALFSVYMGHSGAAGMGLDGRFLTRRAWATLNIPRGRGPFFTCGCFACQSSPEGDGYGLAAVRNPAGPVAVMGATGESYSAPGQLAAEGLLGCLKEPPFPSRLGAYWLAVEAGLARGTMDSMTFTLLDMADGTSGKVPLSTQRLEHLEMWLLLGDPALRMPVAPADIPLRALDPVVAGKPLRVTGRLPERLRGAQVRVTLERRLDSKPNDRKAPPSTSPENSAARLEAMAANFARANEFTLVSAETEAPGEEIAVSLAVPAELPYTKLTLGAYAVQGQSSGLGVLTLNAVSREAHL